MTNQEAINKEAKKAICDERMVVCTKEEYCAGVRRALQDYRNILEEANFPHFAERTRQEIKRLDKLHLSDNMPENNPEPTVVTLSTKEINNAFKAKYIKEFGKLDDRAYFMSGILMETLNELFEIK